MCSGLHVKCLLFLSDFNQIWIFSTDFGKIFKYKFHENSSRGNRVFPYRQTHMTKVIVSSRSFADALKNFRSTNTDGFIHSIFCLTTGPTPLPKRFLHRVRSRASSFKWEYPFLSLKSSSSSLRLLPRLLVTYISPFIFPSITCFRRQFLRGLEL